MDVTFKTVALATLCNSQRRLADRWGEDAGRTVGRRLLEINAADSASLEKLPRAAVSHNGRGETTIDFGGDVVVRGVITADGQDGERIVITSLEVQGSVQR
jgi:hypothetical protein